MGARPTSLGPSSRSPAAAGDAAIVDGQRARELGASAAFQERRDEDRNRTGK